MSGDFTFLKGNIETIILCALYKGPTYGYEIARVIKERTDNKYEIKQPTLYAYLKRLEEDQLIRSYWGESSNGGRRRYYALTDLGRANCENFVSEWQYQRTVLSELVDGTASGTQITQQEATPLFGRRSRRTKRTDVTTEDSDPDEVARRLRELSGLPEEQDETTTETTVEVVSESVEQPVTEHETDAQHPPEVIVEPVTNEPTQPVVEPIVTQQQTSEQAVQQPQQDEQSTQEIEPITTPQQPIIDVSQPQIEAETTPQQQQNTTVTEQVSEPIQPQQPAPQEDPRARFETNQDTPEDFIQDFEARALQASGTQEPAGGDNYQHALMDVIGDQINGVDQAVSSSNTTATYYSSSQAALEDVADSLARDGIRLRIYNHATSIYRSKTLIPFAKVLCQTSWLTYAIGFIIFGVLALISLMTGKKWEPFVISLGALIAVPLALTVYEIVDPTRKNKPAFNFRIAIIVASVLCAIIILASVGGSILANMDFDNFESVSLILIFAGIAALLPASVAIYYALYKQY